MKIDSQKLLPGTSKSLSLIAVRGNKVTALSDTKKTIKFDQFISDVEEKKSPRKKSTGIGSQLKELKIQLLGIEKILKVGISNDERYQEKLRRREENERRAKTEDRLEKSKEKKKDSPLAKKLIPTNIFDAIQNFIGNILLGKFVLFLIDTYDEITKIVKYITPVADFVTNLAGNIFNGIVNLVEGAYDINLAIKEEIRALGGEGAESEYDKFTDAFKKYANLAIALTMAGIPTSVPVGGQKPSGPLKKYIKPQSAVKGAKGRKASGIRDYLSRTKTAKLIEKRYGNAAAKIYENAVKNGKSPAAARNKVLQAIDSGKIKVKPAGAGLRGTTAGRGGVFRRGLGRSGSRLQTKILGRGARLGISRIGSKLATRSLARIPVIGPLIVAISALMEGNPVKQALFKAGGAALGGFLGTFIPIPVLGTLLGTILGEYVGDLFYTLIKGQGGGVGAVGKRLQNDIKKLIDGVVIFRDWLLKGIGNIQKQEGPKIPDFIPHIGGLKIGGWATLLNPFNMNFGKKFDILRKAFFSETGGISSAGIARARQRRGMDGGASQQYGETSKLGSGNVSLNSLTDQDFSDLAYAVSGEAQRGTDDEYGVAANILTRVADPNYPNTIMGVFTAGSASRPQYAAYWDGGARRDTQLAKKLKANKDKIAEAIQLLNGRTDFKGTSAYGNMGPGDIKFSSRGNFYHYSSQRGKNDPPPANPPQHWKKLIKSKPTPTKEAKAKKALSNLRIISERIERSSPGSGEKFRIPGVGTYVRGRNFFGRPEDKYFDPSGEKLSEIEFKKRFKNLIQRLKKKSEEPTGPRAKATLSPTPPRPLGDQVSTRTSYDETLNARIYIQPIIIDQTNQDPLFNHSIFSS